MVKFWNFKLWKTKTYFWCRMSPGIQWCHLFFSTWARTPKNRFLLYDVTVIRNVVEINLAFGGQKLMYRFEILQGSWHRFNIYLPNTVFRKFGKVWILWPFKKKNAFGNFRGQNHKISSIRDSHFVDLDTLHLVCFVCSFKKLCLWWTFKQLPLFDPKSREVTS